MIFLICIITDIVTFTYAAPKLGPPLFDPLTYEATFVKKNPPSISNDAIRRFLRMPDKPDNSTKKPCQGYDYDDTLCKSLDGRLLCGYNKNLGQPKEDSKAVIDLGNGCFSRGDRIECGYVTESYQDSNKSPAISLDEKDKIANLRSMNETRTPETTTNASTEKIKLMNIFVNERSTPINTTVSSATTATLSTTTLTTTGLVNNTLTALTVPTTTFNTTPVANHDSTKTIVTKVFLRLLKKLAFEKTTAKTSKQSSNSVKPTIMCVDKNDSLFCYELNGTKYFIY